MVNQEVILEINKVFFFGDESIEQKNKLNCPLTNYGSVL